MRAGTIRATGYAALILSTGTYATSLNLFYPVEIATGTYLLASTIPGEAQVGIVIGSRSVAVVGAPKSGVYARQIVEHVAELTDKPISHVIVLSQFCDHACASAELSEIATIVGSDGLDPRRAATWASKLDEGPEYYAGAGIAAPNLVVRTSASIDLGGRTVEVRKVESAHDPAALVAYQPDTLLAWAGPVVDGSSADARAQRFVRDLLPAYHIVRRGAGSEPSCVD